MREKEFQEAQNHPFLHLGIGNLKFYLRRGEDYLKKLFLSHFISTSPLVSKIVQALTKPLQPRYGKGKLQEMAKFRNSREAIS